MASARLFIFAPILCFGTVVKIAFIKGQVGKLDLNTESHSENVILSNESLVNQEKNFK